MKSMHSSLRLLLWAFPCGLLLTGFRYGTVQLGHDTAKEAVSKEKSKASSPRVFGVSLTLPENTVDYSAAFNRVYGMGGRLVELSLRWDEIETAPGVYNPSPNYAAIANAYFRNYPVKINFVLQTIDTDQSRVPADIAGLPFDSPVVIQRFKGVVDYLAGQMPDLDLETFSVGNEVDDYLGTSTEAWRQYRVFFASASANARTHWPHTVVGVKMTFPALTTSPKKELAMSLNALADGVFVNYYDSNPDFTQRPPEDLHADWKKIIDLTASQSVYFLEYGYSSGTISNGSETKQAEFYRRSFLAWDKYKDRVRGIFFMWLHDLSPADIEFYRVRYGVDDPKFLDALGTLGLRTWSGSGADKPAMTVLTEETAARGF